MDGIRLGAGCPRHSGPGILPGASTRHGLVHVMLSMMCVLFAAACSHAAPPLSQQTPRGSIQYSLHTPETPGPCHVILAHGFLRSPRTMDHLAKELAEAGIATACIKLKRSNPLNGNHAENARDMIALRQALGWKNVTYAGFSAGGLSALLAAAQDSSCEKLLLLDPVDSAGLGLAAAPNARVPTLAILGKPGAGNAYRNASAMLAAIPNCRVVEIPEAAHCDFEVRPSAACHLFTASVTEQNRTTTVHEIIFAESSHFLKNQTAVEP